MRASKALPEAALLLEDGSIFPGFSFGAIPENFNDGLVGEVVFNTAMTGYQEILTDPSYYGQIVVMTYPHIGNYGINPEDMESNNVRISGFVVHEFTEIPSNWRSKWSLPEFLRKHGIPALCGVDTRALTRHIRNKGAMNAYMLCPPPKNEAEWAAVRKKLQAEPGIGARDLCGEVSCKEAYTWDEKCSELQAAWNQPQVSAKGNPLVAVLDLGVKHNMLRSLTSRGCRVKVLPSTTSPEEILALKPAGLLLSNGPGDPAMVKSAPETVRALLGKLPIFGICMGHQILAQAIGAKTFKMKFGHHGANQPILDVKSGRVMISSQNHGYAIDPATLPDYAEVSQVNLNDKSVEGIFLGKHRAMSVQYHPEACPGPRDTMNHFDEFVQMLNNS